MGPHKPTFHSATCWLWLLVSALLALAPGPSASAKPTDADRAAADQLFASTNIPLLRLEISQEDMQLLKTSDWQKKIRPSVPCLIREGATVYTNVLVHLRGTAGSFRPIDLKPGLSLNFDKNAKSQRFHGLDKISLNNSAQDPSYVTDKLCREIYDAAGVPVPRATYARVQLNERELGLFLLTEGWDKQFLARYFKNTKGNFYERGNTYTEIHTNAVPKFGKNPDDRSHLAAIVAATKESDHSKRLAALEKALDLDRFVTLLALDVMTWNWDGILLNNNNYRFYHDPDRDRVVFFPQGMDQMFQRAEGPLIPGSRTALAKAALQIPEFRQRLLDRITQLWGTTFDVTRMTNRVQELSALVQPALRASGLNKEASDYRDEIELVQQRIVKRGISLSRQMEGVKGLLKCEGSQPQKLESWALVSKIGEKLPNQTSPPAQHLEIQGPEYADKLWGTTLWLEGGTYRIEGLVKTEGLPPLPPANKSITTNGPIKGAGFRIWSRHKFTEGLDWGWFPYTESRNLKKRGLLPPKAGTGHGLGGDSDWQRITYDFELRQPIAELGLFFELREGTGKALLDRESVTITRLKN